MGSTRCIPATGWSAAHLHLTQRREINLDTNRLYGRIKPRKRRGEFLGFLRYLRSLYPPDVRIAIVLDNYSPHLSTRKDRRVGRWAVANDVELAYTPTNASWLNRIEGHFAALRYFTLDATDHASHEEAGLDDPPLYRLAES